MMRAVQQLVLVLAAAAVQITQCKYEYMLAEANDPLALQYLVDDARENNFNFLTYSIDIIVDPCRGHASDCCFDIFGTAEYERRPQPTFLGWLWATSTHGITYKCQKPCFGNWELANSLDEDDPRFRFDILDSDENEVWGVNLKDNFIFMRKLDGTTAWRTIAGDVVALSASARRYIYGISSSGELLRCAKPCTGKWNALEEVEGHPYEGSLMILPVLDAGERFIGVDGDNEHLYLVTSTGKLFVRRVYLPAGNRKWVDVIDAEWTDISQASNIFVTKVSVSTAADAVWIVDADHYAYKCAKPCLSGVWTAMMGYEKYKSIDADQTNMYGVNHDGKVVFRLVDAAVSQAESQAGFVPTEEEEMLLLPKVRTAHLTVPADGFELISASSNPLMPRYTARYTVEREAGNCMVYSQTVCVAKEDENCIWNVDSGFCERRIPDFYSRLQDLRIIFDDPTCTVKDIILPGGLVERHPGYSEVKESSTALPAVKSDSGCVENGVRLAQDALKPVCWDNNSTLDASQPCQDVNGTTSPYCVSVAITSTNYIVQCGGKYADDRSCGTFLEVHVAGSDTALSETRVPLDNSFTSGYRTMEVSTLFQPDAAGRSSRMLCRGSYELWFVQRTKTKHIVEYIKKFAITEPLCDWNSNTDAYELYKTIASP